MDRFLCFKFEAAVLLLFIMALLLLPEIITIVNRNPIAVTSSLNDVGDPAVQEDLQKRGIVCHERNIGYDCT